MKMKMIRHYMLNDGYARIHFSNIYNLHRDKETSFTRTTESILRVAIHWIRQYSVWFDVYAALRAYVT